MDQTKSENAQYELSQFFFVYFWLFGPSEYTVPGAIVALGLGHPRIKADLGFESLHEYLVIVQKLPLFGEKEFIQYEDIL